MKLVQIGKVKPNPKNPRIINDDKFQKLVASLQEFPEMASVRPIVCNTDMVILGGNMRFKAMMAAGWKEVPVEIVDWAEDKQAEFVIKDNVSGGEWDWDALANEWDAEALEKWGLDLPVDFSVELEAEDDNYQVPDEVQTDIVLGDLFEIGEHRLLCGDSTDSDAVARLMNGEKAEMLFTSPPYSDMREYNGNKDLSIDKISDFIPTWAPFANYQVINLGLQRKNNEIVEYWNDYIQKAKDCGYKFLSWNIWCKNDAGSIGNQTAMFGIIHEWIFVFGFNKKELHRTIENKTAGSKAGLKRRNKDGTVTKTTGPETVYSFRQLDTVNFFDVKRGNNGIDHPAQFPLDMPLEYIKAMTDLNDIVAESFIGSGTTMVAAHQLNRKCYGMELDPKYCQVIIDRMLKLDPKLEVKRNGKPYQNIGGTTDES